MVRFLSKSQQRIISFLKKITRTLKSPDFIKKTAIYFFLFIILYWIGSFLPEGFDWKSSFKVGRYHPIWTPWTKPIIQLLAPFGYGVIFSLSVIGISLRAYRYKQNTLPIFLALISMPTLWVFFIGNIDGLVLFGLLFMPAGIPLVLMKPQLAAFLLLAKRSWIIWGFVFGIFSLLIWGMWPLKLFMVVTPEWKSEWMQDISLFPWGLILGLPLLWFSRGDQDLLMAAGSLFTPHLFPYHFILLMPALARMKWQWMIITWLLSWTPLLSNWLGPSAWHFGNILSLCFWIGIFFEPKNNKGLNFIKKDLSSLYNQLGSMKWFKT